ncbi:MAG TPA: hypothetical protein VM243_20495 [Phycisphaerae bacterium]|nr:hypothetical protein [Phycisphaerae bacterium]
MTTGAESQRPLGWLESCDCVRIFRTFRLAIQPSKLILAFAALVLTLAWGGILDQLWSWAGQGADAQAIVAYQTGLGSDFYEPSPDQEGIFTIWAQHTARCIESAPRMGTFDALALLIAGCGWLVTSHPWYTLLFYLGALIIWSLLGGAICRIAAVQFARDEKIGWREAVSFVWQRFFSGFFLAPLLPLLMILVVGVFLVLGGIFLRIPYLGDIAGSLLFFLALLGGMAIGLIFIGWLVGGWLFWPTIATEGSEALDAVSRSFNYIGATPWRTVFYALVAAVYGYLCFWFVRVLAYLVLASTHLFVGFGTAPFGWWLRDDGMSKLDALWAGPSMGMLRASGTSLTGVEAFAGAVIGVWVFVVVVLVWAYLASFSLSASTVIYFLLRRANDAMDLDDVYIETYEETEYKPEAAQPAATPADSAGSVPLTVEGKPPTEAPPPADPAQAATEHAAEDTGQQGDAQPEDDEPGKPPADA